MIFAYIGPLNSGGTCLMRGKILHHLLPGYQAVFINTRIKLHIFNRVFQSIGFRYKRGPLIPKVNGYIKKQIQKQAKYDFIWVDKAIYLTPKTTQLLKSMTSYLIHFTPDTAFLANRSRLFFRSLPFYDWAITTKWFDREYYLRYIPNDKLIFCTQGYDLNTHSPRVAFEEKLHDVAFIGLCEPSREEILNHLLKNKISVVLAGFGWGNFVKKNSDISYLFYQGVSLKNEDYAQTISSCHFSPGLLSKRFPEKHTTRTFEIPACGTALLTERNSETGLFFAENEAVFFDSPEELVEKIKYYKSFPEELKGLTERGRERVVKDGRDYGSVLKGVLEKVGIMEKS